jgi:GNAT superfamily N-acetyltransferase
LSAPLAPGLHAVPPGHLATIVTHLEMTRPPAPAPAEAGGLTLRRMAAPGAGPYRTLFRAVGAPWLWRSRLAMADDALAAVLRDPRVEVFAVEEAGAVCGMMELDFREAGACELAFLGLTAGARGRGAGRWLMGEAQARAWARAVARLWVHTCTLDHPGALAFYRRAGFAVTRQEVEVLPDPRLDGLLPRDAAPHVPLAVEAAAPAR